MIGDKRLRLYELDTNEHVELEQLTVSELAAKNKEQMLTMLLEEAQRRKHTHEGRVIHNEILAELKGYKSSIGSFFMNQLQGQISKL